MKGTGLALLLLAGASPGCGSWSCGSRGGGARPAPDAQPGAAVAPAPPAGRPRVVVSACAGHGDFAAAALPGDLFAAPGGHERWRAHGEAQLPPYQMDMAKASVAGALAADVAGRYLRQRFAQLEACFTQPGAVRDRPPGVVSLSLAVLSDGTIGDATATGGGQAVDACLAQVARSLRFPAAAAGSRVAVKLRLSRRKDAREGPRAVESPLVPARLAYARGVGDALAGPLAACAAGAAAPPAADVTLSLMVGADGRVEDARIAGATGGALATCLAAAARAVVLPPVAGGAGVACRLAVGVSAPPVPAPRVHVDRSATLEQVARELRDARRGAELAEPAPTGDAVVALAIEPTMDGEAVAPLVRAALAAGWPRVALLTSDGTSWREAARAGSPAAGASDLAGAPVLRVERDAVKVGELRGSRREKVPLRELAGLLGGWPRGAGAIQIAAAPGVVWGDLAVALLVCVASGFDDINLVPVADLAVTLE